MPEEKEPVDFSKENHPMQARQYEKIPSKKQFQSDSSVTLEFRKDDIILTHLDWLLERYEAVPAKHEPILCDLFLTCNTWIKEYWANNRRMLKQRYPAVTGLFDEVVRQLARRFGCSEAQVPNVLRSIYGRDLDAAGGVRTDCVLGLAKYLKSERMKYRIKFKGGLAHQRQWWLTNPGPEFRLADSYHAFSDIERKDPNGNLAEANPGYGLFVMTLEREFYMAKPDIENGFFHSSINDGGLVTMAGTMKIVQGRVTGVCPNSGHYRPTLMNMALMLQAIAMYGVDLHPIRVLSFQGQDLGNALDFLRSKMTWDQFEAQRVEENNHRIASDNYRSQNKLPKPFGVYVSKPIPLTVAAPPAAPLVVPVPFTHVNFDENANALLDEYVNGHR